MCRNKPPRLLAQWAFVQVVFTSSFLSRAALAAIPADNFWPNPTVETGIALGDPVNGRPLFWTRWGTFPAGAFYPTNRSVSPTHSLLVSETSPDYTIWWSEFLDIQSLVADNGFLDFRWHELFNVSNGSFRVTAIFNNLPQAEDFLNEYQFAVRNTSSGWASGTFTPRQELLHVPAAARYLQLQVVSGGVGSATGDLYVDDISVSPVARLPELAVPARSTWKYLANGTDQGTAWREVGFNDSSWSQGAAELGYGEPDQSTTVGCGPSAPDCNSGNFATVYFRRTMEVDEPAQIGNLQAYLLRDDAAAVYLNGVEVYRDPNLPPSATFSTYATLGDDNASTSFSVDPRWLRAGVNVWAVEVHQSSATSSDLSFDFEVSAAPVPEPTTVALASAAIVLLAGRSAGRRLARRRP